MHEQAQVSDDTHNDHVVHTGWAGLDLLRDAGAAAEADSVLLIRIHTQHCCCCCCCCCFSTEWKLEREREKGDGGGRERKIRSYTDHLFLLFAFIRLVLDLYQALCCLQGAQGCMKTCTSNPAANESSQSDVFLLLLLINKIARRCSLPVVKYRDTWGEE